MTKLMKTQHAEAHPRPAKGFVLALEELTTGERAFLSYLLRHREASRSTFAEAFGYSKTKTNALITSLIDTGYLVESEDHVSTGGRGATVLRLRENLAYVIGIDLGATSVRVALSNMCGEIIALHDQDLDVRSGPTACLKEIIALIRLALQQTGIEPRQLAAIGMGVPGPIEFGTGLLIAPPIMPNWGGYAVRDHLVEEFGTEVFIDNEVNLMALGEMWRSSTVISNALFVKVSTGIGAGILSQGRIYRGADGAAGDIGHICAEEDGPNCTCGNTGCLEAIASGSAIASQAERAGKAGKSDLLAKLCAEKGTLTLADVGAAVREGDQMATSIIKESGQQVGRVLAGLVNFFNPERIIIGGSITQTGYLFLAAVRHAIYNRSLPLSTRHLTIEYSHLEGTAGVSGAVILAWQELFYERGRQY